MTKTLTAFNTEQENQAKILLATQVSTMMGRKFEEADWSNIYCKVKGIPEQSWSNVHIDVMYNGLGVEQKMLCVSPKRSLREFSGTTLMHPSATRSIRIESTNIHPNDAMNSVLLQYSNLIDSRTKRVESTSSNKKADMRMGWLLWERSLTEFMYFEEPMLAPNPEMFYAEWHERSAKGSRKSSKNLWIYECDTGKKRYSVTTSAGIKIQPYFDVPPPNDDNLIFFRVQGEDIGMGKILIWISSATGKELLRVLGSTSISTVSSAILETALQLDKNTSNIDEVFNVAIPIEITDVAYNKLLETWGGVSDEHRVQLLLKSLKEVTT